MLSEDQVKALISENELLQLQLRDVNEMISIREEELDLLRERSEKYTELRSRFEGTLNEMTQMQNIIGEKQRDVAGSQRREMAMEDEIIRSIEIEKQFYEIRDQQRSATAELQSLTLQADNLKQISSDLAEALRRNAELESKLQIETEEKELLSYQLSQMKKKYEALQINSEKK